MKILLYVFLFVFLFTCHYQANASHIVGGEVTYSCMGDSTYEVSVTIYEDCLTGDKGAIAEDNPAFISVFDGKNTRVEDDSVFFSEVNIVPVNFTNACVMNIPRTCLQKKVFTHVYHLPPNSTGYLIVYQRCCRNASIINIINPANVGATYYCNIPPALATDGCNNSAVFKNYPPQIICISNPLVYDNSATDADGDSLSYEFCNTYIGGSDGTVKPIATAPPFINITYMPPFNYNNPIGGYPQIQIDPVTGLITGTPNRMGRYVVTVCCHEWRHGIMINTLKREFQFVVTNCSKAVIANIPQFSDEPNTYIVDCKDYTVHFKNISKGGFTYHWDFGDGSTSTEFEPAHTYADTGTFTVKLVVNPGSTCPDSISRLVKVYPSFRTDFDYSGLQCPGALINFKDMTFSTYKPVSYWSWGFGDGDTSSDPNPSHTYTQGGTYNVMLVSKNHKGCTDTLLRQLVIERFTPFAGNDTIIIKGQHIDFDATGGTQYTWTPTSNLDNSVIANPRGDYPDTGTYRYNVHIVSSFGCSGNDSIKVQVVSQGASFLPNAFTPNGDGKNDVFRPVLVGYRAINYFKIFDRWGQVVFFTTTPYNGWDGTSNGVPQDMDTYYWELDVTDKDGNNKKLHGDVILVR